MPRFAALNTGGDTRVDSISCATTGNCAAGGSYSNLSGGQAFVVSERNGIWRKAIAVPGLATLNAGGSAEVYSVSCAAPGFCGAGGYYFGDGGDQAFVVTEKNGVWRKAIEVPGSAALNVGYTAEVNSISCARPRSCAAGGGYLDGSSRGQAFVVNERNGIWRKAVEVRGLAARNVDGNAEVTAISCANAGYCSAGGYYTDGSDHQHAFVVNEKNGGWRKAVEVPGSAALNVGGAVVSSVSCAGAGACAAGGWYTDSSDHGHAFVVTEKKGVWRKAIEVPGVAALNIGGDARVASISCTKAGFCSAGGYYTDGSDNRQAFVVTERNGVWRKAVEVPGSAALNVGGSALVTSISCARTGPCAALGYYNDSNGFIQAFVTEP